MRRRRIAQYAVKRIFVLDNLLIDCDADPGALHYATSACSSELQTTSSSDLPARANALMGVAGARWERRVEAEHNRSVSDVNFLTAIINKNLTIHRVVRGSGRMPGGSLLWYLHHEAPESFDAALAVLSNISCNGQVAASFVPGIEC